MPWPPSDSKDFALVVIFIRLVLGAGEIAHSDKLLQGRATSRHVLSLCYRYILPIILRFLVLYFFRMPWNIKTLLIVNAI